MSSPINPILVVQNNLPEYEAELLQEREKLIARIAVIDEQLNTCKRLYGALIVETMAVSVGDECPNADAPGCPIHD